MSSIDRASPQRHQLLMTGFASPAINGVELEESAIPAVAAHPTTGLALAIDITITVFPQPVAPQAMTLWHAPVVVLRQEWNKMLTECVESRWAN